jgi:Fic family protein
MFGSSGSYEPQMSKEHKGALYYTFTPKLLCNLNNSFIATDNELMMLLSQAHRLLGILEGMSQYIPDIGTYTNMLMKKEALLSCQIDRIDITFYDILYVDNEKNKNVVNVLNYITAMKYAYDKTATNNLLCETHGILMKDSDNENIGNFRKTQTFLKPHVFSNIKEYNPTAQEDMKPVLDDIERFMKADGNIDILIKSALIHYQFETIHPFESGNGRVGRILAMLILLQNRILSKPVISLSYYLFHNKIECFDRLSSTRFNGDYAQWIKFFIRAIIVAADNSIKQIKSFIALRKENMEKIKILGKASRNTMLVYEYIEKNPVIGVRLVADELDLSFNTVAKAVEAMADFRILKQANNQSRHRCFIYEDYIKIFDIA